MTLKRIVPLEIHFEETEDEVLRNKINELVFSFNELISTLKPGWNTGENKGYENEVIDHYRIKEPE